uniref:Proprotein convertase subtilisin/kexin type 9 n=1 Tax=Tetraodon nigroviridis TaxID=99883 RepID=H3DJS4_TETNG
TAEILKCNKPAWRLPGQYLVLMRPDVSESEMLESVKRLRATGGGRGPPLEVLQIYTRALRGFLVRMRRDALRLVARLPQVLYVEEDSSVFAQAGPWSLRRLPRPRGRPGDGAAVEVYLMDGSVLSSHRELGGRVLVTDFHSVPVGEAGGHREASRCKGHGTHVAAVVMGSDTGVAPGARVNLVRVLDCRGKGTVSGALAGVEYIRAALRAHPPGAAVVLLPFTGAFSRSLNAACRDLVNTGAVVVAAAGNYRDDACLYSPASEPEVITVGAVNSADQLVSQGPGGTNVGRCVDVFAPGGDIVSASSDCDTCFASGSGTSQAAAHAAGMAAVLLSSSPSLTPVQVLQTLLRYSVSLPSVSGRRGLVTPSLVAALPPDGGGAAEELLCRSVWSERSRVRTVSQCRPGEEMMSCSSHAPDGAPAGHTTAVVQGQCVAYGGLGVTGVHAVARCCVVPRLQCWGRARPRRGGACAEPQPPTAC